MKNYITIAALLAAGTGFAEANTVDLVTTFSNANQSSADAVTLSVAEASGVTATADLTTLTLTNSSDWLSLKTSGAAGGAAAHLTPDTNVGNGAPWVAEFLYELGGVGVTSLIDLTLDVILFSSVGAYQTAQSSWTGDVDFTATITSAAGLVLGTLTGDLNPNENDSRFVGKSSTPFNVELTSTNGAIDLSSTDSFTLKLSMTETLNNGTFVGLSGITKTVSVVPEPSAFGLLAGLGALALVASRRRRTKKA